jgi:hypothetical protein
MVSMTWRWRRGRTCSDGARHSNSPATHVICRQGERSWSACVKQGGERSVRIVQNPGAVGDDSAGSGVDRVGVRPARRADIDLDLKPEPVRKRRSVTAPQRRTRVREPRASSWAQGLSAY